MHDCNWVAYYRVSTQRQGESGLGLAAQRTAVEQFLALNRGTLIAEFTEVESGRNKNRPQFNAAIKQARRSGARLVIAKLDRLSRSMGFIQNLLDGDVEFVCADQPYANRMMLQILGVVAENEAIMIGQRTKAALAAAKARGVRLGSNSKRVQRADAHAASLAATLAALRSQGLSSTRAIAAALNAQGIASPAGTLWSAMAVKRVMDRLNG